MRAGLLIMMRGSSSFVSNDFSLCVGAPRADAGIVDKYFQAIAVLTDRVRQATHLGERGKIRGQEHCPAAATAPDLLDDLFASVDVATMNQDTSTLISQSASHEQAHPVGRAGYQYGLAFQVQLLRHVETPQPF
jgi:hypothetical protein